MASNSSAAQDVAQQVMNTFSGPVLATHAPIPLEAFRSELNHLLERMQAYHWSAHFPVQAQRIYGTGTHNLSTIVTSIFIAYPALEAARLFAWSQFATIMDCYVNAGRGTTTEGTWMRGLKVAQYDTDISNAQLEALVVCLLAVKADVDGACQAAAQAGSRAWWVVPGPVAHLTSDATASGLGVFKFEDESVPVPAVEAGPQPAAVHLATPPTAPAIADPPVEEMEDSAVDEEEEEEEEENPWDAFLAEEKGFGSTADCMSAMMNDETFFQRHHWTVVEI